MNKNDKVDENSCYLEVYMFNIAIALNTAHTVNMVAYRIIIFNLFPYDRYYGIIIWQSINEDLSNK